MWCVFSPVFYLKVKYRHYYAADISNSTDASVRIVSKWHNIFRFHKIYIGYVGSWTTWILYYFAPKAEKPLHCFPILDDYWAFAQRRWWIQSQLSFKKVVTSLFDTMLRLWMFPNHLSIWFCARSWKCGELQLAKFLISWLENRETIVLRSMTSGQK